MKKRLILFLAVCLLSVCSSAWADYWNEGHAGTAKDPYVIDSIADLVALRDRVNAGTEPGGKYYKADSESQHRTVYRMGSYWEY